MADSPKKLKRKTNFDNLYTEKYNFSIKCSSSVLHNSFKFRCAICSVDLSRAYGRVNDVDHHIKDTLEVFDDFKNSQ